MIKSHWNCIHQLKREISDIQPHFSSNGFHLTIGVGSSDLIGTSAGCIDGDHSRADCISDCCRSPACCGGRWLYACWQIWRMASYSVCSSLHRCTIRGLLGYLQYHRYEMDWSYWQMPLRSFVGNLLKGQTVGFIGAGRIGTAYARMMVCFTSFEILYHAL